MDFFDIRFAFEDFVENNVFKSVESVGSAIEKVGDGVVDKICEIEDQGSLNPVKTAAIGLGVVAAAAAAPAVLGYAAAAAGAGGVATTGIAAALTTGEVLDAAVLGAASTTGAIVVDKVINAVSEKKDTDE